MRNWVVALAIATVAAGCKPKTQLPPGEYVGSDTRLMEELYDNDVFLRINGEAYTKADFKTASSLLDKIRRMCAGDPLVGPNRDAERATVMAQPAVVSEILRRGLIRQFAAGMNVEPEKEEVEEYSARFLKCLRREGKDLNAVARELGRREGRLFLEYVAQDVLAQPLRRHFDSEGTLNILDADIESVSNRISATQRDAEVSNAVETAVLEKAIAEIKSGKPFAEVAERYSETPEDGKWWGDYLAEEIEENPTLVEWLSGAVDGDVSGILELDDGYSVVKVLSRHPEDLPQGETRKPRTMWEVARISRKCYDGLPDRTREEIIEGLLARRNKALQHKIGDAIMEKAVIEWPYGTNLFEKAANNEANANHSKEE